MDTSRSTPKAESWIADDDPWQQLVVGLAAAWTKVEPGPLQHTNDDGERYLAAARAVSRGALSP